MSKERAYIDIDWIILMMCLHLRWCNDNKLLVTISTNEYLCIQISNKTFTSWTFTRDIFMWSIFATPITNAHSENERWVSAHAD